MAKLNLRPLQALLLFALACGAAACSSGSSSGGGNTPPATSLTVSGQVTQGPINGATVGVYAVNASGQSGSPLGTTTTNSSGAYSVNLSPIPSGPVRIEASGGSFVSESNGASVVNPESGVPLSALLPSLTSSTTVNVNALTTFIDSEAVGMIEKGTAIATAVTNATTAIEKLYGLKSSPMTLTPSYLASAVGTDAGNLGLILGAIINEDQALCPDSPGALVGALAQDLHDGVFDGTDDGSSIVYCNQTLPVIAGTSQFIDSLLNIPQFTTGVTSAFISNGNPKNALVQNGVTAEDTCVTAAGIANGMSVAAPPSVNKDVAGPDLATGRYFSNAVLLPAVNTPSLSLPSEVMIDGGGSQGSALATAELYNPEANTFTTLKSTMNQARQMQTSTLLRNGMVLIAGGSDGKSALASTELYDPATQTFAPASQTATMATARWLATATLMTDGQVLIAGGSDQNNDYLASTEIYNPTTNSFSPGPTMNTGRDFASAVLAPDGGVIIFGGSDAAGSVQTAEVCELGQPTCTAVQMLEARTQLTATLLPNRNVLVAGGYATGGAALASTEIYNEDTQTFTAGPSMNVARGFTLASLLPNGNVAIFAGANTANITSCEIYLAATNTFAPPNQTPTLTADRCCGVSAFMPNGKVLIAAGEDNGGQNTSDVYTP
jgi:hypothetical protein